MTERVEGKGMAERLEGEGLAADSFVALLRQRAQRHPDRLACAFLGDGENITDRLTYGGLDESARRVADLLGRRLAPDARALLVCEPGLGFVTTFFGCLYAGVVAVPVVPPTGPRSKSGQARIRGILADSGAEVVLTTGLRHGPDEAAELFGATPRLALDDRAVGDAAGWRDPGIRASTVAFLQYTSGSTGVPRGVVLTHANLLANQRAIAWSLDVPAGAAWMSWLPMYHDMGLIGTLMQPLYRGAATYLMSPLHFLQSPARWARAVSRHRAYVSGGPNFAYDLAARRVGEEDLVGVDLSGWRVAFSGAEPIRPDTVARFAAAYAPAGLDPACLVGCYGLAESTLLVSGAWATDPKNRTVEAAALDQGHAVPVRRSARRTRVLPSAGRIYSEYDVRIVDPSSLEPLADREVGEILVAGPSVASGYWRRPDETAATFGATLAGNNPTSSDVAGLQTFLRTGDLGFLDEGQLYVTGRTKDLLIVRGRNVHPHDVEDAAQRAHPYARPGGAAAFALDNERVVLVQETRGGDSRQLAEVATALRRGVLEDQQVRLSAVYLVPPREVPKTSSGKVRRSDSRRALLAGELRVLYHDADD
jgi:acyl-CoA synthetase (AMP-forming)/AMP-acid ligase II